MKGIRKNSIKFIIVLVLLVATAAIWYFSGKREKTIQQNILIPVRVIKPGFGTLEKSFRINAYVESESMVTVLPKISGTLISFDIEVGDELKAGDIIGKIDPEAYILTLQQAEAAYLAAKSTYDRVQKLFQKNAATKQNLDEAQAQYDAYKSQYELARLQYSYTDIKSPINGVVLMKHTYLGSLVAPQVPIVTIGDLDNIIIKAKIPENYYYLFLKKKDSISVKVTVPALQDQVFDAKIKTISPYISPETKNFEVICSIPQVISDLRPGMFTQVNFILDKKENIYYLPFETLLQDKYVWYVDKTTNQAKRMVVAYLFASDNYYEIGDQYKDYLFIIDGQHFLKEDQEIKIIEEITGDEGI